MSSALGITLFPRRHHLVPMSWLEVGVEEERWDTGAEELMMGAFTAQFSRPKLGGRDLEDTSCSHVIEGARASPTLLRGWLATLPYSERYVPTSL